MSSTQQIQKRVRAERRRSRVRGKVFGTGARPRLSVNKTLRHVFAQIIDDTAQKTIVGVGSESKGLQSSLAGNKTEQAKQVGMAIAKLALEKGIQSVVFDRNSNRYHGRVKALAEGAREAGLQF